MTATGDTHEDRAPRQACRSCRTSVDRSETELAAARAVIGTVAAQSAPVVVEDPDGLLSARQAEPDVTERLVPQPEVCRSRAAETSPGEKL